MGTAVALVVRCGPTKGSHSVFFRHLWGKNKRAGLLASAGHDGISPYHKITPAQALGFPFFETTAGGGYFNWPSLAALFPVCFSGVKTSRDDVVTDIDRACLERRMRLYLDSSVPDEEIRLKLPSAMDTAGGFDPVGTRKTLLKRGLEPSRIMRFCYRPFDYRWIYWESETKLLDRSRPEYVPHVVAENLWIEARQKQPMDAFDRGYVTRSLADNFGNGLSSFFPLLLNHTGDLLTGAGIEPNISQEVQAYLSAIDATPDDLFHHAIAILHAPAYRSENQGALRQDWPRIPLPLLATALKESAQLGREVVSLLDIQQKVQGVAEAPFRKELQGIAVIERFDKKPINPDEGDLELNAGWGHAGLGGVTMPGKGKAVNRGYSPVEQTALSEAVGILGPTAVDVYLNERVYWRNVPVNVWNYTISGYAVVKKWLSYREKALLGRSLTVEEVRYITEVARRIAALILLGPTLDQNYLNITEVISNCNSN